MMDKFDGDTRRPSDWINRHALPIFFGLAYAISWSIWALEPRLIQFDPILARSVDTLGPYGPTFAALLLAALLQPGRRDAVRARTRWVAVGLTLLAAGWVLLEPWSMLAASAQPFPALPALLLVMILPAWLVWLTFTRQRGIHQLLRTFLAWRVRPALYFWTLLFFPLAGLLGLLLWTLLGQSAPVRPQLESVPAGLLVPANLFVATAFYGGPFGEEVGWRGFALPRLQARYSPLTASIILGLLWGFWHFPLHVRGQYDDLLGADLTGLAVRMASGVVLAILFTWLYNRSGGNLWLMVLLHTVTNNAAGFWLPVNAGFYMVLAAAVVALVVHDKMYRRLPLCAETVAATVDKVQPFESDKEAYA